jgi:hypothetical protein
MVFSAPAAVSAVFTSNGTQFAAALTNGGLELEPNDGPTSLTQILSLRVPVAIPDDRQLLGYLQDVTFGVKRSPDVRVLIVADLAGAVKTVEFDFENPTAEEQNDPMRLVRVFSPQGLESAGGGQVGLPGPVAAYTATISITIQRRTLKGQGRVQIDNLDVSAILSPPTSGSA